MHQVVVKPDPAMVLAKATLRASNQLGLNGAALAKTLGVSESTISRMVNEEKTIEPGSKTGELAILLVRVFRSLDALVGSESSTRLAWMTSRNKALSGIPSELVLKTDGLVRVLNYLDGMRAPT